MAAKKYRDIKKEFPIEEGKLVSDFENILTKIMDELKSKLGKEYKKNSERGLAMINTVGAMVGHNVTDKKQRKGRLFLKFGDEIEEGAKYTNVHNKIKKIRNLKRKEAEFIASIDPAILGQVVKALSPMFEAKDMTAISSWKKKIKKVKGLTKQQLQVLTQLPTPVITALINQVGMVVAGDENIQEDAAVDAANLQAKQTEEMERLKEKQVAEMEALKDRHERQMDAINLQKEKEVANKQIESEREAARKAAQNESIEEDKEEQDKDVGKNKGTQPKKYYKGLDKETKQKRDAHFKAKKSGPAPGDEDEDGEKVKTKKSTHTKKFQKMFGEKLGKNADAGDYVKDFRKSDAPQFKGKSDKKIQKMAIAAYLDKKEK